jgi:hypothetical protein
MESQKTTNSNLKLPEWIVEEMVTYLYSNGVVMKNKDLSGVTHIPVVVFPSPV